jgi:asparagine synthase (glutamine-hydrolysing)
MCGIIGLIARGEVPIAQLKSARDLMIHRGPDDDGIETIGAATFGFRRLAILDLSPAGHQPMRSGDGQIMLAFNGEIYNYQSLKAELQPEFNFRSASDTEVILNGYLAWGWEQLLEKIDGMFAIALWDNRQQTLYAARDRVGKKPFFFTCQNGEFQFASTLNALVALQAKTPTVDPNAIDAYLTYQAVPAPRTIYQGIYQLAPAHQLTYHLDSQTLKQSRYWDVVYDQKTPATEAEVLDRLDELVRHAVRRRLVSDVPVGAFLSGGVDSSLVVALAAQEKADGIDAVVMGFADPAFDERQYARQVATHLGDAVRLNEYVLQPDAVKDLPEMIWQYGQPLADVSIVPTYYVAKAAKAHVTVVLNGDGGDELFAGYARPIVAGAAAKYRQWVPAPLRSRLGDWLEGAAPPSLKKVAMLAQAGRSTAVDAFTYERAFRPYRAAGYTDRLLREIDQHPDYWYREVWARAQAQDDVDRALYGDFMTYLPDQLLAKMDVSTMAWSVEGRSPLLDRSLIEFAATIPTSLRIRGYTTKYLLKRLAERYVPHEVLYRRKRGFVMPAGQWLRGELSPYLQAALLSPTFVARQWVKPEFVTRMVQEHLAGQHNWGEQLWTLFVLEIWARMMLDGTLQRGDSLDALI